MLQWATHTPISWLNTIFDNIEDKVYAKLPMSGVTKHNSVKYTIKGSQFDAITLYWTKSEDCLIFSLLLELNLNEEKWQPFSVLARAGRWREVMYDMNVLHWVIDQHWFDTISNAITSNIIINRMFILCDAHRHNFALQFKCFSALLQPYSLWFKGWESSHLLGWNNKWVYKCKRTKSLAA